MIPCHKSPTGRDREINPTETGAGETRLILGIRKIRSCQEYVGETEFFLQNSVSQSLLALSFDMSRKIVRMEDGKGEIFPSTHTSSQMDTQNPVDSPIQRRQCWVSLRYWRLLAVSVSGRGYAVEGSFLMEPFNPTFRVQSSEQIHHDLFRIDRPTYCQSERSA